MPGSAWSFGVFAGMSPLRFPVFFFFFKEGNYSNQHRIQKFNTEIVVEYFSTSFGDE